MENQPFHAPTRVGIWIYEAAGDKYKEDDTLYSKIPHGPSNQASSFVGQLELKKKKEINEEVGGWTKVV
ncbi:hypothetical protein BELL_0856g00040 [Botrytis elliptica]|uniref:Uncharacterized protein n=1 Tax=Botrytis elliptica TaxID=278938 RepID=A0A4Z1JGC8_9HELO|nr:hypothetical protein BELL_0856g00040 [Botrytis elliptica]